MFELSQLHGDISAALSARSSWEATLTRAYRLRKRLVRRNKLPFEGAPNLRYPLIDTQIRKLTPFYTAQLTAGELPAQFTFLGPAQGRAVAKECAELFGWYLYRKGNWLKEMRKAVDAMLTYGTGYLHLGWCPQESCLRFRGKLPLYVIMPPWVPSLEESPWVVVVEHHTPEALAESDWCKEKDAKKLKELVGTSCDQSGQAEWEQTKFTTEGVTHDTSRVVVWHLYTRESGKVYVRSYSPAKPSLALRERTQCAIDRYPLVAFSFEKTEDGPLSSQGIPKLIEEFEGVTSNLWNAIMTGAAFAATPLLARVGQVVGGGESPKDLKPGDILQSEHKAVQFPTPPVVLDQQMIATRLAGQELIAIPDLALNQSKGGQRTATEAEMAGSLLGVSNDDRARGFREDLAQAYDIAWQILCYFLGSGTAPVEFYTRDGEDRKLDLQALKGKFHLEPEGSPGTWDRNQNFQKLITLAKVIGQSQDIHADELVRMIVEALEPKWAKRLLKDKSQEQATMLLGLLDGLNALATRLSQDGAPNDPATMQAVAELAQHALQQLAELDRTKAEQAAKALQAASAALEAEEQQQANRPPQAAPAL